MNLENNIVQILLNERPKFNLGGREINPGIGSAEDFLYRKSKVFTSKYLRTSYAVSEDLLKYIESIVNEDSVTLETGAGYTTCVFAIKSQTHYVINPDATSNKMILEWLMDKSFKTQGLVFIGDSSDTALPILNVKNKIDTALIDGCHGFPLPIIDWYYIDLNLKVGSILIIDDIDIYSVKILFDFLRKDESYKFLMSIDRAAIFQKISDRKVIGWRFQGISE